MEKGAHAWTPRAAGISRFHSTTTTDTIQKKLRKVNLFCSDLICNICARKRIILYSKYISSFLYFGNLNYHFFRFLFESFNMFSISFSNDFRFSPSIPAGRSIFAVSSAILASVICPLCFSAS